MLRPIAQTGQDPVYSMGDDAPIAPLAGRAPPARVVLPTALRAGDEPGDRPLPRAHGDVRRDPRRSRVRRSTRRGRSRRSSCCRRSSSRPTASRRSSPRSSTPPSARKRGSPPRSSESPTRPSRSRSPAPRSCASRTRPRAETARRSRRCSPSPRRTAASSSAASGHPARCSSRATRRGTRTWSPLSSASARTSSARASRSRPSPSSPRPTRSAATGRRPTEAQARLLRSLEDGVLKVMSKMGIADVASYRGARLFEAVGLDRRLCLRFFGGTPSAIGGVSLDQLERDALARLAAERGREAGAREPRLLQVPQGRRAACDRPRGRRGAPGERQRCARAREGGQGRAAGPLRAVCRASSTRGRRSSRATCSSSSPRASRCRSTRSSRSTRSCAGSRAEPCRTARSRPRRTRRSRSR